MGSLYSRVSEIVRSEPGTLGDTRKHLMANFFVIVKAEHVIPELWMLKFDVRTLTGEHAPAFSQKRTEDNICFSAWPLTQAGMRRILIESGMSLDFSTSSATAYRASAYAFALASSTVVPYAIAPGTSGISAIQRPSSSCSISNWNRKSRLLTPTGGLRSLMRYKMRHCGASMHITEVIPRRDGGSITIYEC